MSCAAVAVRTFACVAVYIPIYPAAPEQTAPSKNAKAVAPPRSLSQIAKKTTVQKIASRLYSAFINTIAPRCIWSPISTTLPDPAGSRLTIP